MEEIEEFKAGDVVCLKSGSPAMVITALSETGDHATVRYWSSKECTIDRHSGVDTIILTHSIDMINKQDKEFST